MRNRSTATQPVSGGTDGEPEADGSARGVVGPGAHGAQLCEHVPMTATDSRSHSLLWERLFFEAPFPET